MTTSEFLDKLCEELGRDPGSLTLVDTKQTVEEWDSIGHLSIISRLHEMFELPEDDEGLRNFDSIQELVDRLKSHGLLKD